MKILIRLYYFFRGSKLNKVQNTKSTRDLYTLLLIVKQALKEGRLKTGLCGLVQRLYIEVIITRKEYDLLTDWIENTSFINNFDCYWFKNGLVKPRLNIVNKELLTLKPN
jgi:hypothetical protein